MYYLLTIGPLSYAGIALLAFFIGTFFTKRQNLLTKVQRVEYQNIKLEVTLNILVLVAGLLFIYFDYTRNYSELSAQLSKQQELTRIKVDSIANEKETIDQKLQSANADLATLKRVTFDFDVRLQGIDDAVGAPQASDLQCFYREVDLAPKKQADVTIGNGAPGTYTVIVSNILQSANIPFLEILDRKTGRAWTLNDDVNKNNNIKPLIIDLIAKK